MIRFEPPIWLRGGHSQTILPALLGRRLSATPDGLMRQRWATPDGDFVDVDRSALSFTPHQVPLLVLFHGLEGSARSHYARLFRRWASRAGIGIAMPHFRGCSGEINVAPRAYHSGDHQEIDWILRRFKGECPDRPIIAVGVSLGGNALAHWVGLHGHYAGDWVSAAAAVSAPLDLTASGLAIGKGFSRQVYTRLFLNTMVPKALKKWQQYPGLFSKQRLMEVRDLREFDNVFTAPVHGYGTVDNYWKKASAKPLLPGVKIPLLLLNATNDPFVPAHSLPHEEVVSNSVTLWQPKHGGHVGFPVGGAAAFSGDDWLMHMPERVGTWLMARTGLPPQGKRIKNG